MIPDDVEKIIMTKEDYDRNVEQLLLDKCKAELEVERLSNIINELDKVIIEFKKQIEEERKNYREIIGNFVDKLQELKGVDKE